MRRDLAIALALAGVTIVMTWPLALPTSAVLPSPDDAYFSVWRLAWVAHQVHTAPGALFDANIFHPALGTLAFSDAMLLLGMVGAPFIWLGLSPVAVHNWLMLLAFVTSAWAMYALAHKLTADRLASGMAAVIFAFAPYRFAHIGHLELQWVAWMPLSVWLLHRLFEAPSPMRGALLGAAIAGQTLCSIYHGVFLSAFLLAAGGLLSFTSKLRRRAAMCGAMALLPLLLVVGVYGAPYAQSRLAHGPRPAEEVSSYSAVAADYLKAPPENVMYGRSDAGPASDERSLFPGAIALALAFAALWPPVSQTARLYAGLAAFAFDVSLGVNGLSFSLLQSLVPALTSLRSPARVAVLVQLAVAILAALSVARLNAASAGRTAPLAVIGIALCLGEYWSAPISVRKVDTSPSAAHAWLAQQPPDTVVLELPVPTPDRLWLYETTYQFRSIHHWRPLVNGYSGFAPGEYVHTLEILRSFPDAPSMARLRDLSVDVVLVNRGLYEEATYRALAAKLIASADVGAPHVFGHGRQEILAFPLTSARAAIFRGFAPD